MFGNVLRLAALLKKETLTPAEKREAINLAQAMFGTAAHAHGDSVLTQLRKTKIEGVNDPAGLLSRDRHTVIGQTTGDGVVSAEQAAELDGMAAGEFKLGDDLYAAKEDSTGRAYFTLNGKRVGKDKYEAAKLEAEGLSEES